MNNSTLAMEVTGTLIKGIELSEERKISLREQESKLVRIFESLEKLERSSEWSSLKEEVFSNLKESLEKRIFSEATKEKPDVSILNRLSGQWEWARRYADIATFKNEKRAELANVRKTLYGQDS